MGLSHQPSTECHTAFIKVCRRSSGCSSCHPWAWQRSESRALRAAGSISCIQYDAVCITEQVLRIYSPFFLFFFFFDKYLEKKKSSPVDFSASLSVANEVRALYCHSACNKERVKTVTVPCQGLFTVFSVSISPSSSCPVDSHHPCWCFFKNMPPECHFCQDLWLFFLAYIFKICPFGVQVVK